MEKKVFRSIDTLFYNSQCVLVEFHDVLSMPWLSMLSIMKENENFSNIFKMYEIADYDLEGLMEWYVYRKHRNVFKSIGLNDDINLEESFFDEFLLNCMNSAPSLYHINTNLKFMSVLRLLYSDSGLAKKIVIYSEHDEQGIHDVINYYFKESAKIEYLVGEFKDVLDLLPKDSTYVFSDIEKVKVLEDADRISLSSVLIVNGLRYNYLEDDPKTLKVDMDELAKKYVFKTSFFDNFDLTDSIASDNIPIELEELSAITLTDEEK